MVSSQENATVAALDRARATRSRRRSSSRAPSRGPTRRARSRRGTSSSPSTASRCRTTRALIGLLDDVEAGDTVTLTVQRHGQAVDVPVVTTAKDDGGAQIGVFIDPTFDMPGRRDDQHRRHRRAERRDHVRARHHRQDDAGGRGERQGHRRDRARSTSTARSARSAASGRSSPARRATGRRGSSRRPSNCDEVVGHVPDGLRVVRSRDPARGARGDRRRSAPARRDDLPTCTGVALTSSVEPAPRRPARARGRAPDRPARPSSLARLRTAHHDGPSRSAPTTSRTSCRSGWREQVLQRRVGVRRHRLLGGRRQHDALDGDGHPVDRRRPREAGEQRLEVRRRGQLLLLDRGEVPRLRPARRPGRPGRAGAARPGSVRSISCVRTSANTRTGPSQPASATCCSISRTDSASAARAAGSVGVRLTGSSVAFLWEPVPRPARSPVRVARVLCASPGTATTRCRICAHLLPTTRTATP